MSDQPIWDWEYAFEILPLLLEAFRITLLATVAGMSIALVGGLVFTLLRRAPLKWVAMPSAFIVEFIRSTPLLIQIYFVYFVFPNYGIQLNALTAGILALGIHYSAYTSEVYRAGVESVSKGQWEAAAALNLPRRRIWQSVIIPQALPPVVPALGNYFIAMFKDTPLLAAITVYELLNTAKGIASETFRAIEPYTLVGLIFLVVSLIAAQGVKLIERKFRIET